MFKHYSRTCSALLLCVCCLSPFHDGLSLVYTSCVSAEGYCLPFCSPSSFWCCCFTFFSPNYLIIVVISACRPCCGVLSACFVRFGLDFPRVPSPLILKREADEGQTHWQHLVSTVWCHSSPMQSFCMPYSFHKWRGNILSLVIICIMS